MNLLLLAATVWAFVGEFERSRELAVQVAVASEDVAKIAADYAEGEVKAAQYADPDFAEREARLKLNLRRPGEEVVVLRGGTAAALAGEASASVAEPAPGGGDDAPNPVGWWRYFFKRLNVTE